MPESRQDAGNLDGREADAGPCPDLPFLNAHADAALVTDGDGRILGANAAAGHLTGSDPTALRGRPVTSLFAAPAHAQAMIADAVSGRRSRRIELGLARSSGRNRVVSVSVAAWESAGRRPCVFVELHDTADRQLLEQAVLGAADREQARIGRELHDGLGQLLTGLSLMLEATSVRARREHWPVSDDLRNAQDLAAQAIALCRGISHGLSPVTGPHGDLREALASLARTMNDYGGPRFATAFPPGSAPAVPERSFEQLLRIAQEACTNALRHADARTVVLGLEDLGDELTLWIEDDGVGISSATGRHIGLGLQSMRARAGLLGATLSVIPSLDGGTRVECRVPGGAADRSTTSPALCIVWREEYRCGHALLDEQHARLFQLANEMLAALGSPAVLEGELIGHLDALVRHIEEHFRTEERVLEDVGYARLHKHRDSHRALLSQAAELRRQIGAPNGTGALLEFVCQDVVSKHLLFADRDYFARLAQHADA